MLNVDANVQHSQLNTEFNCPDDVHALCVYLRLTRVYLRLNSNNDCE